MGIFRPEMVAVVVVGFAMSKVALLESAEATLAIRICFLFVNIANVLAHIWFYRAADGPDSELPPVVLKSGRLLPVNDHDKAAALLQLRSAFASVAAIVAMHIVFKTSKPLLIQCAIMPYRLLNGGLFKVYWLKQKDLEGLRPFSELGTWMKSRDNELDAQKAARLEEKGLTAPTQGRLDGKVGGGVGVEGQTSTAKAGGQGKRQGGSKQGSSKGAPKGSSGLTSAKGVSSKKRSQAARKVA